MATLRAPRQLAGRVQRRLVRADPLRRQSKSSEQNPSRFWSDVCVRIGVSLLISRGEPARPRADSGLRTGRLMLGAPREVLSIERPADQFVGQTVRDEISAVVKEPIAPGSAGELIIELIIKEMLDC